MALYVLKVVPGDWEIDTPLPFTDAHYQRIRDQVKDGTRIVIYQDSPENAVVAEAEVGVPFIHVDEWKHTSAVRTREKGYLHLLPVRILYRRAGPGEMSQARVRDVLKDRHFPTTDHDWIELSREQYEELIRDWE
jgi:hypothetical protein